MNKTVIAAAVLCMAAGTPIYSFAADPCEVVLCMYGKATGNSGGSECRSAEKAFFNIVKKNKHGFLPNHTGNDSNLLIVFYVQIVPDDFVMQLHRF